MSKVTFNPYLFFTGNCKEAMEFYKGIFGGEVTYQMHYDDPNKVMHAQLDGGEIEFMGSDGDRTTPYETCRISLSLSGTDTDKLTGFFKALAEGGNVESDLKTESWGDTFGMVTDKYGVDWMVNITSK